MKRLVSIVLFLACSSAPAADADATPQRIFEQRIVPIFKSPNPSSCVQCHLAGVDLKQYILPSADKTFLSLRDQGLVDLQKPLDSKILRLIKMGEEDRSAAALLHDKVRKREYEAFALWIQACCKDEKLREAPRLAPSEVAKPTVPVEVIQHARKDRLLESFERNVWAHRFRCMGCHQEGTTQNAEQRKKHGERVSWMKQAGALATMNYLIGASTLIDEESPEKSLLLQKPLGVIKHGGGKKFVVGDLGYKGFRAWLEDYAAIVGNRYTRLADLPAEKRDVQKFGTDIWIKLDKTLPEWGDKLLVATLYAWDDKAGTWEKEPIAMTDRVVWGQGKQWQHNLTLVAATNSERARTWIREKPALPPGRYMVRIHVDRRNKLATDWKATLDADDFAGQAEVTSRWPEGYGKMTVIPSDRVKMP